jgi:hypothetical protein
MMIRLSYASQIAAGQSREEIDAIVVAADGANRCRGITGVISFDGKRIVQILEGSSREVDCLFNLIRQDPRHVGIVELARTPIDKRAFAAWGMTLRPASDVLTWAL